MKRHVWCLLVICPALLGVAVIGCYQESAPKQVVGAAPSDLPLLAPLASQPTPATEESAPTYDLANLPDGMMAIVLNVPGMT